jgi:ATP-dependent Clp protease ATP-binding subunit ClpA
MKLSLPIGVRRYGDTLVIAQVLDELPLSAAADNVEEAIAKLREAARRSLERAHPRALARLGRLPHPNAEHVELGVFTRRVTQWRSDKPGPERLSHPTTVLTRRFGEMLQTSVPTLSRSIWTRLEAETTPEIPKQANLERLAELLSRHEQTLAMHRAVPDEFLVDTLEVDFEPLDLARMPADSLWLDAFGEVSSEDEEGDDKQTLNDVARDWTLEDEDEREQLGIVPAFCRDDVVEQLTELVFSSRPAAVVVVGPARVGKTSIIKHLGWLSGVAPERAGDRHLWFADSPRLTSTDPMSGGWQEQCASLVEELESSGDALYIGRLIQALDAGKYVGSDYNLAQFLKPHLSDRRLRIIAEATVQEWNRIEQRDIGFARAFNVVRIDDPTEADSAENRGREIVARAAERMSKADNIEVDDDAIERAWRLEKRFATEGSPVGRAIDFLGRTLRRAAQAFSTQVTELDLVERFCDETGLPPVMLLDDRTLDLATVQSRLAERVMGQDEAVRRVAHVVGITKAGLAPADRPLGSFFFVGPTGVGKTELARALAEFLFGDDERLIRLDMSEYSHPDAYSRLIGEGKDDGDLTAPVRRQPFSVILLDEVEKAHRSVYDLLLQVLGEARLTDADGRTTRFQNAIVIMTSNLGVDTLRPSIGFGSEQDGAAWEQHFRKEAERFFRPEFLARIDQFIPFRSLSREVVEAIARRELEKMSVRDGLGARDIEVEFGDDVVAWVASRGWDEQYGARPIKRVVEQQVAWPLARTLARSLAKTPTRSLAGSPEEMEEDCPYLVRIEASDAELRFGLEAIGGEDPRSTRRNLLAQVERIAALRRRLERCMYGEIFAELEWQVHDFDSSSQAKGFWELPDAAETARSAEHARDLTRSVSDLSRELEAIEDLVREAYHTRSFELTGDIDERVEEIGPRLREVFLELLRSAYDEPDKVVLFMPATDPQDPWREKMVRWYRQLANRRQWKLAMRRSVPRRERPNENDIDPKKRREALWEHARKPSGTVLALEFSGTGVRPLLQGEDGLHRKIAEDKNANTEVFVLSENIDWPKPSDLEGERPTRPTARTWNFRTGEISMRGITGLEIDEDYPWDVLWPKVEDVAWELAGADWW